MMSKLGLGLIILLVIFAGAAIILIASITYDISGLDYNEHEKEFCESLDAEYNADLSNRCTFHEPESKGIIRPDTTQYCFIYGEEGDYYFKRCNVLEVYS